MKKLFWLIIGIGVGFIAAHFVARNPQGKQFFDDVDSKAHQFVAAIVDGYRDREAELSGTPADADGSSAGGSVRFK